MKTTNTVTSIVTAVVIGTAGTLRAISEVSNVTMEQRENSRIVDIGYTLSDEAAIVTLSIETNGVALPDSAVTRLSGDVCKLVDVGTHSIVWNAGEDWPEHTVTNVRARVTAWQTNSPPQYCAVDLIGGYSTNVWPVYYYPNAEGVPGGVTNNLYKTYRILMRRVGPTGGEGFTMGSPLSETGHRPEENPAQVVLTKSFYVGVYEVTVCQWQQAMGDIYSWPSYWNNNDYKLMRPVERVSYYDIRESLNADDPNVEWPSNELVTADSFMGRMQTRTGLAGFDLPTEAQWEYACRAETTGALNDGTINLTNTTSDARLDALGRYAYNGGMVDGTEQPSRDCAPTNATAIAGSYSPNAWGLYDMHGNVWEWCLDWYADSLESGVDPAGADSALRRVKRGGAWNYSSSSCRSAYRSNYPPSYRDNGIGFRLFRTLP